MILHEYAPSGNCYKIRLVAAMLGIPIERRHYDIVAGETRTPAFLRRVNADGRIPVLEVDGRMLPESGAACWYLAEGSELIPADAWERAEMLRWMFFEQYSHEPNVATLRFWLTMLGEARLSEAQRAQIAAKRAAGDAALDLMEAHLAARDWFVGDAPSLADIALYGYTHVAHEGGFDLAARPVVAGWCARIAALPGHVPIHA